MGNDLLIFQKREHTVIRSAKGVSRLNQTAVVIRKKCAKIEHLIILKYFWNDSTIGKVKSTKKFRDPDEVLYLS